MSERILKALMQLFAIIADVDDVTNKSRAIVQSFLKQQLNQAQVEEYLNIYDQYLEIHHKISAKKDSRQKRTSLNSVKVLRICSQINEELTQRQKVVVLVRLLEYVYSDKIISEQEMEFISTVSEAFNIVKDEFVNALTFITCDENNLPSNGDFLLIDNNQETEESSETLHIYSETLSGSLLILRFVSVGMYVVRYFGDSAIYLNGQILNTSRSYILNQGSSIRSSKLNPIYYSDIISSFMKDLSKSKVVFKAKDIKYVFKGGNFGLRGISFEEESGTLFGIMGGSGAGKSTLLNVLNGTNIPSEGEVTINGVDIHTDKEQIEGVIGYISQDDLLIEELTVFQNLYYNAKLCFAGYDNEKITSLVNETLKSLGLFEAKDLKVGSPLDKKISGGQRKRLNIALELIREPTVLFVDEPTSGLSSRDSENIMDLLKELALKGKLVFVVIHQPSSDIFKMFDKLLILDVGGYPVYYGNPVDGVIYFKKIVQHVKSNESECIECGNVNPEQIFNILESKVLDEYGNQTDNRKISPKEWNDYYKEKINPEVTPDQQHTELPGSTFHVPSRLKQFKVFITRDVLSKLTNSQYLLINLLEAPTLGLILSYFVKYFNADVNNEVGYIFRENENLPAYMFMAVVVAIFIGLTVSAEEIIRDQKIRKRESFLHLSKGSYLFSKIIIMCVISAIQTWSFILIGNYVMEIKGMWFDYWLILFSSACFANMLGLNISASFNSAVTIYILIPFLIIPQLLFSGVIVKFDKLNPAISSQTYVPAIGEMMASRWAFEALAVNQFKKNDYERMFYKFDKAMSIANFKKNFWIPEIKAKIGNIENNLNKPDKKESYYANIEIIKSEVNKELKKTKAIKFKNYAKLNDKQNFLAGLNDLKVYIDNLNSYYIRLYNSAERGRDDKVRKLQKDSSSTVLYNQLKDAYTNESLTDLVKNQPNFNQIIEVDGQLVQKIDPIFLDSDNFRSHFFAPRKKIFGKTLNTFLVDILVIWMMSIIMIITLYFDVLRKLIEGSGKLVAKLSSQH